VLSAEAIRARIVSALPDADVVVRDTTGTNDHFEARVVSAAFESLGMVQQHQRVYAPLQDWLATGELHALALKTYTPAGWLKAGGGQPEGSGSGGGK
jgi:acid stress-induced BolA-like protein IbaG/YrbA